MRRLKLKTYIIFIIISFIFCGCSKKDKQNEVIPEEEVDIAKLVNVNIPGWKAGIERVINYEQGLRLYVGRTADLYLAYGFKKFATKEYKNRNSLSIMVEVYDFGNSKNAYGIYSFDTTGKKMDIGNDASYGYGILRFWKGRLFVRIVAQEEYRQLEKSIIQFAKAVDQKIPNVGERPHLLTKIPQEKIVPDTLHFFHENLCLNNIYYIPESYTLGLSDQTDVVTAQYSFTTNSYPRLFVIEYPDELSAQNAYNAFTVRYYDAQTPVYKNDINIVRTEEDDYNSISIKKNFVILVFESHSAEINKKLTKEVLKRID
ncbi:MAG: DUF6599 family protein [Candidatus Poribacteria bacterium]